jgi:hypothetical protein
VTRKHKRRFDRSKAHVLLACRRREALRSSSGGGDLLGYLEGYAVNPVAVPQPPSGVKGCDVECESCGMVVRVWVASPFITARRRFMPLLLAAVLGLGVVPALLLVPTIQELSERAFGGPYTAGLVGLGVFALVVLVLLAVCLRRPWELHAVRTSDFKHRILPE